MQRITVTCVTAPIYCQSITAHFQSVTTHCTVNSHPFPYQEVLVGATVSCHVSRALDRSRWSNNHFAPILRDMSAPPGSASESRTPACPPAPKLAAARWPGTPPAQDWTQIPHRARTDQSPLQRVPPVNNSDGEAGGPPAAADGGVDDSDTLDTSGWEPMSPKTYQEHYKYHLRMARRERAGKDPDADSTDDDSEAPGLGGAGGTGVEAGGPAAAAAAVEVEGAAAARGSSRLPLPPPAGGGGGMPPPPPLGTR